MQHSTPPTSTGQRRRLCCLLERWCKHPPLFTDTALTVHQRGLQQEFSSNIFFFFCLDCCRGTGHGVVTLWGEDGVTRSKTMVFFYPQAVWMFQLLLLCLSKAMKAACWLTTTGVAVTASDIWTPPIFCFLLLDGASYVFLLCFHWDAACYLRSCD